LYTRLEQTKSPRERILDAAGELFQREATHAVTLDRIVAEAKTTKMAFYRHFEGREALVAEWLAGVSEKSETRWEWLATEHPSKPIAQIQGWIRFIVSRLPSECSRGCPFANTAAEISGEEHPASAVIEDHRAKVLKHLRALCKQAHLYNSERLARVILYTVDGAQANASHLGPKLVGEDLVRIVNSLLSQESSV